MLKSKIEIQRVEKWLFDSHKNRPDPKFLPQWQQNLMREILLCGAPAGFMQKINGFTTAFTRTLFWFAGLSAPVAVVLLLIACFYGPDMDAQVANLAMNYTVNELHLETVLGF